jgi:hypothetical protein
MSALMRDRTMEYVNERPLEFIPELNMTGKILKQMDLTVKININIHDQGFLNRDICRIIAKLSDGKLYIKRLEDGHKGIVSQEQVYFPTWERYTI